MRRGPRGLADLAVVDRLTLFRLGEAPARTVLTTGRPMMRHMPET
jgi:hypothetical protein